MRETEQEFSFLGGHPAVDLVNTVANRGDATTKREMLRSVDDVVRWVEAAGLAADLEARWMDEIRASERCVARFRAVREALGSVFAAAASGAAVSADALASIDRELRRCGGKRRLTVRDEAVGWDWCDDASACDVVLYALLTSAVDLLTSPLLGCVRVCDGPGCGWIFLDRSQAGRRRWCSMKDCGNRAKARRYYHRG